jgi:hypothetical protein
MEVGLEPETRPKEARVNSEPLQDVYNYAAHTSVQLVSNASQYL